MEQGALLPQECSLGDLMSEFAESHEMLETVSVAKSFAKPSNSPEELADLVSGLSHQQKAEVIYELVLFATMAAEETGHPALNEFLAELEDLAAVYTDPERGRDLRRTMQEAFADAAPAAASPNPVDPL